MPEPAQSTAVSPTAPVTQSGEPRVSAIDPSRVRRRQGSLWHLISVATGLFAGVGLLLIGHKYFAAKIFPPPQVLINYQLFTTPNPRLMAEVLIPAVNAARTEVLVSANDLSSRLLLEALRSKFSTGTVDVVILLPAEAANGRVAQWVVANKAGRLYIDSHPTTDQILVVDGRNVILTTIPFNASAPTEIASTGIAVDDPTLAKDLRRIFLQRVAASTPVL